MLCAEELKRNPSLYLLKGSGTLLHSLQVQVLEVHHVVPERVAGTKLCEELPEVSSVTGF